MKTHFSSSIFFFIMSLLHAGIEARRAASSSACRETRVEGGKTETGALNSQWWIVTAIALLS